MEPRSDSADAADSMARLAMWAALVATVVGAITFSVTYGITGRVHISSILCVGAATLVNYSAKRCPVTLGGIAETVRRGIMQLVMNYTMVGFAILYALVVHYVLYVEPVNARAAAVSLPMLEGPATANYYSPAGWYNTGGRLQTADRPLPGGHSAFTCPLWQTHTIVGVKLPCGAIEAVLCASHGDVHSNSYAQQQQVSSR